MKYIILVIINFLGWVIHFLWNTRKSILFSALTKNFYTAWAKYGFNTFGKKSLIDPTSVILNPQYIKIGHDCTIGRFLVLTAYDSFNQEAFAPEIIIGDNCSIGDSAHITAINRIIVGNNFLAGKNILITDNSHGRSDGKKISIPPLKRHLYSSGPVIIGDNVWIGDKVSILPNVSIGDGCVIGTNAVVTKNVPPYSLVVGNPAKIIKCLQ